MSPLTIKFTAEPIPVPPASGALTYTDSVSLFVITIGYDDSKNVVSFGAISIVKNLFAVTANAGPGVRFGLIYMETLAVPNPVLCMMMFLI